MYRSVGSSLDVVERSSPIRQSEGVQLLDYSSDDDHNRTVITYVELAAVEEASFRLTKLQ